MTDFLLELRSEEIPARMQDKAREDLARLFTAELAKAGLAAGEIVTYATPRRLALIARDLPHATEAVSEELKGPRAGAPPQALEGFLRKTGLSADQLVERDGILFAVIDKPGRATAEVLALAIPQIIFRFPWPKSMRWGAASKSTESLRWVRPLQGVVALFGEEVVHFDLDHVNVTGSRLEQGESNKTLTVLGENIFIGLRSGAATVGHRFHHPGTITIGSATDYVEKLRACHVIVDQAERRHIIALGATMAARKAGLDLVEDDGLLTENAGLTEWPVPLLGRFDDSFLDVPPEVIQLTARVNQKYFVCRDSGGKLANAFVCTANIDARDDGEKIVEGNRKVLAARLADARFFYETDLKVPLEEQAAKLEKIVFHEKLGTVADKVDRVAKLARWLVEEGIVTSPPLPSGEGQGASAPRVEGRAEAADAGLTLPLGSAERAPPSPSGRGELADQAERAARLAKADLVTGMVGEFPELQGLMGGYYAAAQGEDPAVVAAIRDHYKPVGAGDEVPTDPVTVAVSLADKLDTLSAFFFENMPPSGSRDPFALRRSSLGIIALIERNALRVPLRAALTLPIAYLGGRTGKSAAALVNQLVAARSALGLPFGQEQFQEAHDAALDQVLSQEAKDSLVSTRIRPAVDAMMDFFADRLKVQQREAGVRHDLIDAVFALGGEDDLVRLLACVHALQSFVTTEDGANLLAGYKRAANILKKEGVASSPLPSGEGQAPSGARGESRVETAGDPHPSATASLPPSPDGRGNVLSYTPEKDEAALIAALDAAGPAAADAVAHEDFEAAMAALATLRAPIDAFFDSVTVNDPDPAKRTARLALLARVRDAVHGVADFSKIEG